MQSPGRAAYSELDESGLAPGIYVRLDPVRIEFKAASGKDYRIRFLGW